MESKFCMNEACRATNSAEWKKGWILKSGGIATLCYDCGLVYENSVFCETFHLEESGWRECRFCRKRIHCGCIASKCLHDYLDFGGIGCLSCIKCSEAQLIRPIQIPSDDIFCGLGKLTAFCDPQSSAINCVGGNSVGTGQVMSSSNIIEENHPNGARLFLQSQKGDPNSSSLKTERQEYMLRAGELGTGFSHLSQQSGQSSILSKPDGNRPTLGHKDMYESLGQPSLHFSFSPPLGTPNSVQSLTRGVVGGEKTKLPFKQGQRSRHILPKPSKSGLVICSEGRKGTASQPRVARPPVEGRGRNQLLPRYWPKITDQELKKISGDLNSTVVPLFEKVLSASDAGRIGRLVLPKACAEAYFPAINQSDGVPIRMKDQTGKEWTFQFRFWPNNNSRMYVLEGVTPCIQNMQLEAGDTVTFSRIGPEGKLVMGCRKASSNSVDMQDGQTSALPNGGPSGDALVSHTNEVLSTDTFGWTNAMHNNNKQMMILEKKKSRNIGSKSKRLLIHNEDAIELRITWEEAQDLLRPPPSSKPTIVMVDNNEVEEYMEPPVFGKRTIFTAQESGEQEQWAQCDSCSKWRRLPVDILLPAKWACFDNIWDSNRSLCSAPEEMDPKKLESCITGSKDFKKRRITENKVTQEAEPSGLDALATAAVLGDDVEESVVGVTTTTTRHPRHRPGCTCIVCIQPPSGKGKHKSTCECNVCTTVKRRFNTFMLRKKKRREREAEIDQDKGRMPLNDDEAEVEGTDEHVNHSENERGEHGTEMEVGEESINGHLDLNYDPSRVEEEMVPRGIPSEETYTRQNGVVPCLLSKAVIVSEGPPLTSVDVKQEKEAAEE